MGSRDASSGEHTPLEQFEQTYWYVDPSPDEGVGECRLAGDELVAASGQPGPPRKLLLACPVTEVCHHGAPFCPAYRGAMPRYALVIRPKDTGSRRRKNFLPAGPITS